MLLQDSDHLPRPRLLLLQVPYMAKPWTYLCHHPYKEAFFEVLSRTPWKGWAPIQREVELTAGEEFFVTFPRKVQELVPSFDRRAFLLALVDTACELLRQDA